MTDAPPPEAPLPPAPEAGPTVRKPRKRFILVGLGIGIGIILIVGLTTSFGSNPSTTGRPGQGEPVPSFTRQNLGPTGSSQVSYVVDAQGRVASSAVTKADRPEFGLALQAAVERFDYEPALKHGQANRALLGFEQDFLPSDHNLVTEVDFRLLRLEQKHPERIARSGDLDSPIKAVITRPPIFPRSLAGHATRGEALVDLLVDEDGHARLPRVVSASEPAFGYSAVQAAALSSLG